MKTKCAFGSFKKALYLCVGIQLLAVSSNVTRAAVLRYYADVAGQNEQIREESLVAPMSVSVDGFDATPPFGTLQWDVFASTLNGALAARAKFESVRTLAGGPVPGVGGMALAAVDDTLYLSRGQGRVPINMTLKLIGSRTATPGTNPDGGQKAACYVRLFLAVYDSISMELSDQATETKLHELDTSSGIGDIGIPITYSLSVQGEATEGISHGDYSHTAFLYISAPAGVTFRTESGQTYALPGPDLNIQILSGNVLISWPAAAEGYRLETTAGLGAGNSWSTAVESPALVGQQMVVTNSVATGPRYFRLTL
jgi:hypothetical protein